METKTGLKLELGECYVRRDGLVVQLKKKVDRSVYPYRDDIGNSYTETGKYIDSEHPDDYDLVEKYVSQETKVEITAVAEQAAPVTINQSAAQAAAGKPSKHAEIIKLWAMGETIQCKGPNATDWHDILPPGFSQVTWRDDCDYRLKPKHSDAEIQNLLIYKKIEAGEIDMTKVQFKSPFTNEWIDCNLNYLPSVLLNEKREFRIKPDPIVIIEYLVEGKSGRYYMVPLRDTSMKVVKKRKTVLNPDTLTVLEDTWTNP